MNALPDESPQSLATEAAARATGFFQSGQTLPIEARRSLLRDLDAALTTHTPRLAAALDADLGKPATEAMASEIAFVQQDIRHALRHLQRWTRDQRRRLPLGLLPGRSWIRPEPYGVVLIIGPWNYPLQLLLSPLVAAVAAGNSVVAKPSEHAPHTAAIIADIVAGLSPDGWLECVTGDVPVAQALLAQRFDRIFFTGNGTVGRDIMAAAARHLTPVTLELGGKSPCIVCPDAHLEVAARRIVWGKFMNAGQTCVAPDTVYAHQSIMPQLLDALSASITAFYGNDPRQSKDYGRIIHARHIDRLRDLMTAGRVVHGGRIDPDARYIEPTLLVDIPDDASIMQTEIFGPILPILPFDDLDALLDRLRRQPTPLALYLFTDDRRTERHILHHTRSGGVCVNDTLSHILSRRLPFGGLGESGMGAYHGKTGFDEFTHRRSVMRRAIRPDPRVRYPPARLSADGLRRLLGWLFRE